jgi:hypothetical protein
MLAAVRRFLSDEPLDVVLELRRTDAIAEVPHAVDEELLALGEENRQCVEEMGDVQPFRMPGAQVAIGEVETQIAAHDVERLGFLCSRRVLVHLSSHIVLH